jgi:hypothetical protein
MFLYVKAESAAEAAQVAYTRGASNVQHCVQLTDHEFSMRADMTVGLANEWYVDGGHEAPFPMGTLLFWQTAEIDAETIGSANVDFRGSEV